MSIPEEAGKIATSTIDALKAQPALLVLVLMQLATIVILAWIQAGNNAYRHERELLMLRSCLPHLDGSHGDRKPG